MSHSAHHDVAVPVDFTEHQVDAQPDNTSPRPSLVPTFQEPEPNEALRYTSKLERAFSKALQFTTTTHIPISPLHTNNHPNHDGATAPSKTDNILAILSTMPISHLSASFVKKSKEREFLMHINKRWLRMRIFVSLLAVALWSSMALLLVMTLESKWHKDLVPHMISSNVFVFICAILSFFPLSKWILKNYHTLTAICITTALLNVMVATDHIQRPLVTEFQTYLSDGFIPMLYMLWWYHLGYKNMLWMSVVIVIPIYVNLILTLPKIPPATFITPTLVYCALMISGTWFEYRREISNRKGYVLARFIARQMGVNIRDVEKGVRGGRMMKGLGMKNGARNLVHPADAHELQFNSYIHRMYKSLVDPWRLEFEDPLIELEYAQWNHEGFKVEMTRTLIFSIAQYLVQPALDILSYCNPANSFGVSATICPSTRLGSGYLTLRLVMFPILSLLSIFATRFASLKRAQRLVAFFQSVMACGFIYISWETVVVMDDIQSS
ncbi:hypothetical protein HDV05_007091, partial [Chytridiales sp. JEL 0842]